MKDGWEEYMDALTSRFRNHPPQIMINAPIRVQELAILYPAFSVWHWEGRIAYVIGYAEPKTYGYDYQVIMSHIDPVDHPNEAVADVFFLQPHELRFDVRAN